MNKMMKIGYILLIIGSCLIVSGIRQKTIDELREEVEFYRTHTPSAVVLKDIEKIYTLDIVSVSDRGVDATLLYRIEFPYPLLHEEGKYFRIEVNVFGRND